jgi:hypothetical protein
VLAPAKAPVPLLRFGGQFDGGYLVPDDLDGITACFSPGVKDSADFELDVAARGIPCFLADYSVDKSPVEHPLFQFEKRFIGATEDDTYMTLDAWVRSKAAGEGDLLLQMDIEGFEYETMLSVDEDILKRFRIMVVEFHTMDGVFSKRSRPIIAATFKKILKHFHAVHIHPQQLSHDRPIPGSCGTTRHGIHVSTQRPVCQRRAKYRVSASA